MPRTREENDRIRQLAKENIRKAAIDIFIEKGYHSASIDDVAKRAGISKGLMYNYFKGKADLLAELVRSRIDDIARVMEESAARPSPAEQLQHIAEHALASVEQSPHEYRFYLHLQTHPEADAAVSGYSQMLKDEMSRQFQHQTDMFRGLGVREPELQSLHFSTTLHGIMLMYATYPEQFPLEELKARVLSQFLSDSK